MAKMGKTKRKRLKWLKEDEEELVKSYNTKTANEIAKETGRTVNSIYGRAKKLGLKKIKQTEEDRKWSERDTRILIEKSTKFSIDDLVEMIGFSRSNVSNKIRELGLVAVENKESY